MEWLDLNLVWYLIVGVLFAGYAVLDGFDLGVGMLHLFTRGDHERRISLNSIGPVWDGNEVWLVTAGGALFAAFPEAYATAFSGFYTAFMLLLFGLIFRAVAIEFRSKQPMAWWRRTWDIAFSVASFAIAFLMGVALGNLIQGVPLDAEQEMRMSVLAMLNPFALMTGVTTVALFMMHGAIYLVMKSEDELQARVKTWVPNTIIFFTVSYASLTMGTLVFFPHMAEPFREYPALFLVALAGMLAIANIPREITAGRFALGFLSSSFTVVSLLALVGIGLYPHLLYSQPNPENSLHIYNAASSQRTLGIMLILAFIGMPFVLSYTIVIYRVFRGKVKLDSSSY
jgi:cytochrome d ubiquinol oxidase subunit II